MKTTRALFTRATLPFTLGNQHNGLLGEVSYRRLHARDRCVKVADYTTGNTYYVDIVRARALATRILIAS